MLLNVGRRKFRSQTSDNMDRWKSGKGQQRERKEKQDQRRESQKKEDAGARKVEKSRITMFFPVFFPEGRQVGSLKRRVRSIWSYESSQVGSGSVGCDLGLAVEVRQCPL